MLALPMVKSTVPRGIIAPRERLIRTKTLAQEELIIIGRVPLTVRSVKIVLPACIVLTLVLLCQKGCVALVSFAFKVPFQRNLTKDWMETFVQLVRTV